jgi:Ca-activated chloride channel family protein
VASRLMLERMMHRQSIAVPGDSMATYALVKLIPGGGSAPSLPLNLALALDISGSMYWDDGTGKSRLDRIREASLAAIDKLGPNDRIAIVAFANGAQVVLPSTPVSEKDRIKEVLAGIDRFDVDQAGTTMHEGIGKAMEEISKSGNDRALSQVVVLTDGETAGESICRELAEAAKKKSIRFSVIGIGTEWNSALLKDLARVSDGRWYYIDAEKSDEAMKVFLTEFDRLADTGYSKVEINVRPVKDVKVKRLRLVVPQIKEIPLKQVDDRLVTAELGTLERSHQAKYILDLSLPKRPDGKYVVAQIEVKYNSGTGNDESTGPIPLEMSYTSAGHGYVNAEVARHIDEVQIFELNSNLQQAIHGENKAEVQRVAEQIAKKGEVLGPRGAKKTQLARQVLEELNVGGKVSKKTQLAVDDAARSADDLPPS